MEREPRTVQIHELELLKLEPPELELSVRCTKGTYVRTLAEDIGEALGCGAHVVGLRRTGVGPYGDDGLVTMEQLQSTLEADGLPGLDRLLLPVESALMHWPEIRLSSDSAFYVRQGQPVLVPNAPTEGRVRLYDPDQRFIGVGEILDDGRVAPRRLM